MRAAINAIEIVPLSSDTGMVCQDCNGITYVNSISYGNNAVWYFQCTYCNSYSEFNSDNQYHGDFDGLI